MRLFVSLLRALGYIWVALGFFLVIAGLHPFNLTNYVITLVTFAPAFGAFVLAGWLGRKYLNKHKENGNRFKKNKSISF